MSRLHHPSRCSRSGGSVSTHFALAAYACVGKLASGFRFDLNAFSGGP
jgi:hypothetical protein